MYVQISSGTKFQLELTILIFWTKFAQKGYFLIEHGKITLVCVPMVVTYYPFQVSVLENCCEKKC